MTDSRLHDAAISAPATPASMLPPAARPAIREPFPVPSAPARADVPAVVPGGYPLWELPPSLRRLCSRLEAASETAEGGVPLDLLAAELDGFETDLQALAPWWIFDACKYRRNLIRRTAAYEALLLCWQPGQRSPIHDHRGSGCAFRVVEGVVTETLYERTRGDLATAVSMRWLPPGTVCASRDFDIHDVANGQPSADLVTLHVYSPPLRDFNVYRSADASQAS
jgi:cysteine dioxygenase